MGGPPPVLPARIPLVQRLDLVGRGEIKDTIAYRERKGDYGFSPETLAGKLAQMDPDEL